MTTLITSSEVQRKANQNRPPEGGRHKFKNNFNGKGDGAGGTPAYRRQAGATNTGGRLAADAE
jgi:hypothetical protein